MGLTAAEAAIVLGCSVNHVYRLAKLGRLPRSLPAGRWGGFDLDTVEQVSLDLLGRQGVQGHPWWVGATDAAVILGVTPKRARMLAAAGRVPAVHHRGRWLFRRHQLEVVANARDARKLAGEWG